MILGSDFEVKISGGWTAGVVDEKRSIVVESSGIYTHVWFMLSMVYDMFLVDNMEW